MDFHNYLLVLALITIGAIELAVGHVALTYPPARKYDLDFLDNSRTKGPCGMPKGELVFKFRRFRDNWKLSGKNFKCSTFALLMMGCDFACRCPNASSGYTSACANWIIKSHYSMDMGFKSFIIFFMVNWYGTLHMHSNHSDLEIISHTRTFKVGSWIRLVKNWAVILLSLQCIVWAVRNLRAFLQFESAFRPFINVFFIRWSYYNFYHDFQFLI